MNFSLEKTKNTIMPILKNAGATRASFFGSVARGEANEDSDVDILVQLPESLSLFGFIQIKLDLEDALGRKVDLVEYHTLKSAIKDGVLKEQVSIF